MRETREAITDGLRIIGLTMLLLIGATLLFGCRTTRSIDTTDTHVSSRDSISTRTEGRTETSWYQHLLEDTSWWRMIGHITIYDTSQRDSLGASPVKAEVDIEQEHHNAIVQRVESIYIVRDTIHEQFIVKDSTFEKSVYREVTERRTPWYFRLRVLVLIILISFALGGFTAWKIKQNG